MLHEEAVERKPATTSRSQNHLQPKSYCIAERPWSSLWAETRKVFGFTSMWWCAAILVILEIKQVPVLQEAFAWTSKRAQNNGLISQNRDYIHYRVHYFRHFGDPGGWVSIDTACGDPIPKLKARGLYLKAEIPKAKLKPTPASR